VLPRISLKEGVREVDNRKVPIALKFSQSLTLKDDRITSRSFRTCLSLGKLTTDSLFAISTFLLCRIGFGVASWRSQNSYKSYKRQTIYGIFVVACQLVGWYPDQVDEIVGIVPLSAHSSSSLLRRPKRAVFGRSSTVGRCNLPASSLHTAKRRPPAPPTGYTPAVTPDMRSPIDALPRGDAESKQGSPVSDAGSAARSGGKRGHCQISRGARRPTGPPASQARRGSGLRHQILDLSLDLEDDSHRLTAPSATGACSLKKAQHTPFRLREPN